MFSQSNAGTRSVLKSGEALAAWLENLSKNQNGKNRNELQICSLLGITRSSCYYYYYQPRPASSDALGLLNRLDRIFTEHPVYGSRRLPVALLREGRRRVRRLMR